MLGAVSDQHSDVCRDAVLAKLPLRVSNKMTRVVEIRGAQSSYLRVALGIFRRLRDQSRSRPLEHGSSAMPPQCRPLPKERLDAFEKRLRQEARGIPPGIEREQLLRKARQADTASHINRWLNSRELQPRTTKWQKRRRGPAVATARIGSGSPAARTMKCGMRRRRRAGRRLR
jgi:hypothetical protein